MYVFNLVHAFNSFVLGYDSDDDDEEGVQYTRNIKGKKYASLPRDDSFDHGRPRQPAVNGSGHTQTQSDGSSDSNEYNYSKRNRLNSKSDTDDYGSDVEAPSKTSYVKQKPGGIHKHCIHFPKYYIWHLLIGSFTNTYLVYILFYKLFLLTRKMLEL